jgi:hypothetical protein
MARSGIKTITLPGAGRAVRGILAHAQAQDDPLLGIAVGKGRVVLSAPGPSSLVYSELEVDGEPPADLAGGFQAPKPDARMLADGADLDLSMDGDDLRIGGGRRTLRAARVSDAPVEVAWVWPAAAPDVELAVGRDALLDALPAGRGTIRFDGPDKQLVLEGGAGDRRLSPANRPRRRKSVSVPVDFGRLRQAVEPHGERVRLGLTEGRPLTVESESVRAVLSPAEPKRPARPAAPRTQAATPKPVERRDAQREQREAARREQERREAERREAEERRRADEERRVAKAAQKAGRALERAGAQLEAAAQALEGSPIEDAADRVKDLRERVEELQRSMGERG